MLDGSAVNCYRGFGLWKTQRPEQVLKHSPRSDHHHLFGRQRWLIPMVPPVVLLLKLTLKKSSALPTRQSGRFSFCFPASVAPHAAAEEPQCDPTLRDTRKSGPVSSPLLWLPNDAQGITLPSFEEAGRKEPALRRPVAAATHHLQQANASPRTQMNQRFFTFARRILGPLVLSAGRSGIRHRTGSLIAHLSTARAAQFLVDRLSVIKVYRCRDCGREVGFRSRPRTFMECYLLPLFLMQPIRCAACFRRDYWSIITRVRERSHRDAESPDYTPAHAA